jgi:hypothetical protein
MNLAQINAIRANAGLPALQGDPRKADKRKALEANRAARAQASRDLKSKRSSGKGK